MFGSQIKITNPSVAIRPSRNGLKDLKHIENQIKDLDIMPDFGYAEDNYILNRDDNDKTTTNKWQLLTGLLGNPKRFSRLMNFMKLQKLEAQMKNHETQELI